MPTLEAPPLQMEIRAEPGNEMRIQLPMQFFPQGEGFTPPSETGVPEAHTHHQEVCGFRTHISSAFICRLNVYRETPSILAA